MKINNGLTSEKAERLLKKYGKNEIKKTKKASSLKLLLSQFTSPIIILLIAAAVLSFFVNYFRHEIYFDSILILVIVLAAGIAGFLQDYKAEKAIEALQKLAAPKARVIRDRKEQEISASEIVPGDIVVLEGGDVIPADAYLINGRLEINESALTGESRAVKKKAKDKIFSGCAVYTGKAFSKVFNTGMKTKIGKIASEMEEIGESKTPFQKHMIKFTRKIIAFTILVIALTFIISFKKFGIIEAGLIAVSLAVAAIPEDLPAVITIALSLGAKMMAKKKALIRRLAVTESIGSADIICTDKTGTLTEGNMKVRALWFLKKDSKKAKDMAIKCCYYCNDAVQITKGNTKSWTGDETDIALKQFSQNTVKKHGQKIEEISFSSERKMMSVLYRFKNPDKKLIFSKGAPEVIIKKCKKIVLGNKIIGLDKKAIKKILYENKRFASKGQRILALAYKDYEKPYEINLTFIGLVVISDPPRKEVKKAVKDCYSAGIRTIMITGDNPLTAKAIAKEVGIETKGVVTGRDIDNMGENELRKTLDKGVNIFARTNPFHKIKILRVLKKQGHVVVMTGDGVNDALAIKEADVGASMGIKGTEVAKEASDMILLDDNFATIKNAVKEGRRIFDNIRKFVDYLLTCNVAEVIVVLIATLFLPFIPLFPVQILWINLITDGLPALALSIDPARPDILKRKPRKKGEGIINKKLAMLIGGIGIKKSLVILATFFIILPLGIDKARTTLFTGFIMYEFVRIGVIRYNEKLASLKDWFANKFLLYSLGVSLILQLVIIYSPLSKYFKVVPLGTHEWIVLIIGTIIAFILGIGIANIVDKITKEEY